MQKLALTAALLLITCAAAERTPDNLQPFRSVCINGSFDEQDRKNESVRTKLIDRMYKALDRAGIRVADAPCQPNGLTSNRQLNLYFSFTTTKAGTAYSADLEGWLQSEGKYESVTLWTNSYFGSLDLGGGVQKANDTLDELMDNFIADWQDAH